MLIIFTWIYALIILAVEDQLKGFGFSETGVFALTLLTLHCEIKKMRRARNAGVVVADQLLAKLLKFCI
jgi:hypothetical protein